MIIRLVGAKVFSTSKLIGLPLSLALSVFLGVGLSVSLDLGTANAATAPIPASAAPQVSESSDKEKPIVIATLFDKSITAEDITPNDDVLSEMASQSNSSDEQNAMVALASLTKLSELIIEGVIHDYFSQNNLAVDSVLVEKFKAKFASSAKDEVVSNEVAERQVMIFVVEKHMYNTYGKEVVFRQSNPQWPVGAYYQILKNYEEAGKFKILDKSLYSGFWAPFTPPYQYELAVENIDYSQPWWL